MRTPGGLRPTTCCLIVVWLLLVSASAGAAAAAATEAAAAAAAATGAAAAAGAAAAGTISESTPESPAAAATTLRTADEPLKDYCADNAFFWRPDGVSIAAKPTWASFGQHAAFHQGPCLGLSGIGVTQTPLKKIVVIDRSTAVNGWLPLRPGSGDRAFAIEVDLFSGHQRGLDILTDAFCSSAQFWRDGSLLSVGGDVAGSYTGEGWLSVRKYGPCFGGAPCRFQMVATMAKRRWYPTTAQLGDGRMIIVGGSGTGTLLNTEDINRPSIEYYPKKPSAPDAAFEVPLLKDTLPYNLFPFVHVLPSGRVFIFASHKWTLWDTTANAEVPGEYPQIDAQDGQNNPLRFNYPAAATSAMFPVSAATGAGAEVMICGGTGTMAAGYVMVNGTQRTVDDPKYPAADKCFRIQPEAAAPEWQEEQMAHPRVMPMSVLLPSGQLVILGGTKQGHSGLGSTAHKPAMTPEIYDTASHAWYENPLPASKIPRSYHASAVVLHNGAVFISGSNPNVGIKDGDGDFPTEFRSELFHPPYLMPGNAYPTVPTPPPSRVAYGSTIRVEFLYPGAVKNLKVVAAQPGFSTHGANHGMRNVVLELVSLKPTAGPGNGTRVATVTVPGNKNLLPPTWYWLFVVVNGVPNREGHFFLVL